MTATRRAPEAPSTVAGTEFDAGTVAAAGVSRRGRARTQVAQLLVAWLPLGFLLLAYAAAQLINLPIGDDLVPGRHNALGFGLHVAEPATLDRAVFGVLPTAWLQQHLYAAGGSHWYDAILAVVYVSHFVVIPLVTALLWFRVRDRFRPWITAVLVMTVAGTVTYVVYPMAPPWMADELGIVDGVARISDIGWDQLHLAPVGELLTQSQGASNPVAAMPSLHAAGAALVLLFFWPLVGVWRRALLVGYALAMGFVLVYTGEHYVVDVVAGWVAAALGVLACRLWVRWRAGRSTDARRRRLPATATGRAPFAP
ncbi:phosphatase PAP2 family protein [Nakamurella deserti]|uniref:phosphatase PAP2 family protein n=1 Tax=Nakamurella deserti TaxID=2164074 RepID=UPI000DBE00E3|nr:phosphatase PAP2 family protein [Nakamurella deserti]